MNPSVKAGDSAGLTREDSREGFGLSREARVTIDRGWHGFHEFIAGAEGDGSEPRNTLNMRKRAGNGWSGFWGIAEGGRGIGLELIELIRSFGLDGARAEGLRVPLMLTTWFWAAFSARFFLVRMVAT